MKYNTLTDLRLSK